MTNLEDELPKREYRQQTFKGQLTTLKKCVCASFCTFPHVTLLARFLNGLPYAQKHAKSMADTTFKIALHQTTWYCGTMHFGAHECTYL